MTYAIKPGTRCYVCKHAQLTYQRDPSRYAGPWRKFRTTRSLHFGKPVLCAGNTYYFVDGAWMMRLTMRKICSEHSAHEGVSRLPQIKLGNVTDYRPKQRIRRDSEK
jgi:hypothetical protein